MITLSNISDPNIMRDTVLTRLYEAQDSIYPLNEYIAHLVLSKDFLTLKSFADLNPSSSLTIASYKELINSLSSSELSNAKLYLHSLPSTNDYYPSYLYVGSKNSLRYIFSDFIPSAFDSVFSYLSNTHLKQLGSGYGSAFIIYPSFFTSDFSDYNSFSLSSLDSLQNVIKEFKVLQSDNSYLISLVEEKDKIIESLSSQVKSLEYKNYLTSQMTWR